MRRIWMICVAASAGIWGVGVAQFAVLGDRSAAVAALYAATAWALSAAMILRRAARQ